MILAKPDAATGGGGRRERRRLTGPEQSPSAASKKDEVGRTAKRAEKTPSGQSRKGIFSNA